MKEYGMKDWSQKDDFMTKDYQPKMSEFAGMEGNTLNYIERRDRTQTKMANKVREQKYHGRYE